MRPHKYTVTTGCSKSRHIDNVRLKTPIKKLQVNYLTFLHKFPTTKWVTIVEQKFLVFPKGKIVKTRYFIKALKYKHHSIPSLCSCLFIWDNQTTVDMRPAQAVLGGGVLVSRTQPNH